MTNLIAGSASKHSHGHGETFTLPIRNLHSGLTPEERLERLMMFLEAQFGADNVSPIAEPKTSSLPSLPSKKDAKNDHGSENSDNDDASMDVSEDEDEEERRVKERQQAELARLHKMGIPVPGIAIRVDKMAATVWLEDLEVECSSKVFADRVRAVVERAVEVTAPLS